MKLLHSSDWHLGRKLCGRSRNNEFAEMLEWFIHTIKERQVEIILLSGDIFDTGTPGSRAQEQYYDFLRRAVSTPPLRHIVITAGNHDSPSFLAAPSRLLQNFNIYVVGSADLDKELITLKDEAGVVRLIVCAVPFLRDRDLRIFRQGETVEERERLVLEGIADHYQQIAQKALNLRQQLVAQGAPFMPIVAMGHLFVSGGQILDGDGVRDLKVGSLSHVPASMFPSCFSYLALGHLHTAQKAGGFEHIRYSGSPLAIGFNEGSQPKSVTLIEIDAEGHAKAEIMELPAFQRLGRVFGDWDKIEAMLNEYKLKNESIWLEVEYRGDELIADLRGRLEALIEGSAIEILRVKDRLLIEKVLSLGDSGPRELSELDPMEVFQLCLDAYEIQDQDRPILSEAYGEIVAEIIDGTHKEEG